MKTRFDHEPTETHGEIVSADWKIRWVEGVGNINEGEYIVPIALESEFSKEFAALFALAEDLKFAKEVFMEAEKSGRPNYNNIVVRSLIFSGVIAYGRCFGGGVREVRLRADDLTTEMQHFNVDAHRYLINVRDKHVAHSVNAFEIYAPVGILVGKFESELRDGFGVGVITNRAIGLSRRILLEAIDHVSALENFLDSRIDKEKNAIHAEFINKQKNGTQLKIEPLSKVLDRSAVGKRR